ncbi:MAG: threonine ammonia-lyase [Pseudoclavibacter sp.]|nr:threonine ammonia-lyase [Pseudoclavibacter sp.]
MTAPVPEMREIRAAHELVSRIVTRTPLDSARFLSDMLGSPVLLKCENMQRTGSYKIRGASYRLSKLDAARRAAGVVAASAGNHAQGVAYAARELGIPATIFMPLGVPLPKLEATRRYGAEVRLTGANVGEALVAARAFAEERGAEFIHPYDHPDIITGQATLGLDIIDECPDVETIIVPIGGGGLVSGIASAAVRKAEESGRMIRVIGVQAKNSAPFPVSLRAGRPTKVAAKPTIADGIAVDVPGELTFQFARELVDEVVTVSEDDIARAILLLVERAKLVVEPAGAASIAAIMAGTITGLGQDAGSGERIGTGRTVAILSGGNIDPMMLEKVISRGLTASDRYLKLYFGIPDVPGQLATISKILADVSANVIEVLHTRHNKGVQIHEVELEISVETRGTEHAQLVMSALREHGFSPRIGHALPIP